SRRLLTEISELQEAERRPIVLFSEDDHPETMQQAVAAGVNAYIVLGISGNRLRTAVDLAFVNFRQTETLRLKVIEAETALRDRKVIERAKGIIMQQRGVDEAAAYGLLRDRAMRQAVRIADVARMVNDASDMLTGVS
ncbi:MAG: ANTAR domain-containing protein, partial [Gammaproteobacteria bacterium]